jgi:hypothetical protein
MRRLERIDSPRRELATAAAPSVMRVAFDSAKTRVEKLTELDEYSPNVSRIKRDAPPITRRRRPTRSGRGYAPSPVRAWSR